MRAECPRILARRRSKKRACSRIHRAAASPEARRCKSKGPWTSRHCDSVSQCGHSRCPPLPQLPRALVLPPGRGAFADAVPCLKVATYDARISSSCAVFPFGPNGPTPRAAKPYSSETQKARLLENRPSGVATMETPGIEPGSEVGRSRESLHASPDAFGTDRRIDVSAPLDDRATLVVPRLWPVSRSLEARLADRQLPTTLRARAHGGGGSRRRCWPWHSVLPAWLRGTGALGVHPSRLNLLVDTCRPLVRNTRGRTRTFNHGP